MDEWGDGPSHSQVFSHNVLGPGLGDQYGPTHPEASPAGGTPYSCQTRNFSVVPLQGYPVAYLL